MRLHCDGEHAIKSVLHTVAAKLATAEHRIVVRESPRYCSQSNGTVERYCQSLMGMLRTDFMHLHARTGGARSSFAFFCWMVRHAAWKLNRFQPYLSGPTPYQRMIGRP